MKHSPNVLLSYPCFSEEHPQPVCEVSFIKSFFDWDSEDSFSETIHLLLVSFPLKFLVLLDLVLVNYLKGWVLVRRCLSIDGRCVVTIDVGLTLSIDGWLNRIIMFTIFNDTVSIDVRAVVSIVVERLGSIDYEGLVSVDGWLCVSIDDDVVASSDVERHFRNLAWPWVLSLLNPKYRVSDVSTSIDGTCVHQSILIFICRGIFWCRSIALM
ncbi:hypothetical protein IGI04_002424, partial [Brassica rapa subsp. trilocularis]